MGPKDVALANRDGVPQSDELTWFDRLHTKIESLIDVESGHAPSILLDTGRYLETHVHAVGSNVRKLCADFVRELLMPAPNDPIAEQSSVIRSLPSDLTALQVTSMRSREKPTVPSQADSAMLVVKTPPAQTSQDPTTPDRKLRLADCCPVPVEDEHRDEIVALRVEALLQQKTPHMGVLPSLPPAGRKHSLLSDAVSKMVGGSPATALAANDPVLAPLTTGSSPTVSKALRMVPPNPKIGIDPAGAETAAPPAALPAHNNSDSEDLPEICKDEDELAEVRKKDKPMTVVGEIESENEGRGLWFDDVASAEYRRKTRIGRSTSASSLGSVAGRSDASPGQDFLEWEFL